MMKIPTDKQSLRRFLLDRRIQFSKRGEESERPAEICSKNICSRVLHSRQYKETDILLAYMPVRGEVSPLSLIKDALACGKQVYLPGVKEKNMDFFRIHDLAHLKQGAFGILEPSAAFPLQEFRGLMLVPGVGFDRLGNRIGYGGGYYDRYLGEHTGFLTFGLCYDIQLVEKIKKEDTDVAVDAVVTETHFYIGAEK